ncbi:hypothetical protein V8C43DRAFT_270402 [Trichoderma afarasin]
MPFNSEPPPRFSIKSAFARLTSAIHASATAFSSKLGRTFNKKAKIEQTSTHANGESAALE